MVIPPMGTCLISNVATFGYESVTSPLTTYSRWPLVCVINKTFDQPFVINNQPSINKITKLIFQFDSRFFDNKHLLSFYNRLK